MPENRPNIALLRQTCLIINGSGGHAGHVRQNAALTSFAAWFGNALRAAEPGGFTCHGGHQAFGLPSPAQVSAALCSSGITVMNVVAEIKRVAKLTGEFQLRSGATSDTYFDKYQFESDPTLLSAIAERMSPLVPTGTEILAGLEMGGIPIATVLSQVMDIPTAFIRKEAKAYGTCKYAEGPSLQGKRVVLVEDVVSTGGAILDALQKLRSDGVGPSVTVCVVDRENGGIEALARVGVELRSLFRMRDIENAA